MCRTPDERKRVQRYVALYRETAAESALGWIDDPFKPRYPRRDGRPDLSRAPYTMEFRSAERAAGYLSSYLGGGQFVALLESADWRRPVWISPALVAMSGWTLARCRWVREGWLIARGRWERRTWYGSPAMPSWWFSPECRGWVQDQLVPT